jgi:hypothetical protein
MMREKERKDGEMILAVGIMLSSSSSSFNVIVKQLFV